MKKLGIELFNRYRVITFELSEMRKIIQIKGDDTANAINILRIPFQRGVSFMF